MCPGSNTAPSSPSIYKATQGQTDAPAAHPSSESQKVDRQKMQDNCGLTCQTPRCVGVCTHRQSSAPPESSADVFAPLSPRKQKTAYEMNLCDWSSDVCSSDLPLLRTYGVNLPSSLTTLLPLVLGFSPHPPVSVCGTGTITLDSGFSRQCEITGFGTLSSLLIHAPETKSVLNYSPILNV